MKLTIKANNGINKVKVEKTQDKKINSIEIDFNTSDIWSDIEFWLNNADDKFLDYAKMIISKREKMQFNKG